MIQSFAKPTRDDLFEKPPKISYVCNNLNQREPIRALHKHKDILEIMLVVGGKGEFIVSNRHYQVARGSLVIINAGIVHEELSDKVKPMSQFCLGISGLKLKGMNPLQLIDKHSSPVYNLSTNIELYEQLFKTAWNQIYYDKQNANIVCGAVLSTIIGLIIQDIGIGAPEQQTDIFIVQRATQYIDANFAEDLTLDIIANELNISKYYLSRLFKEHAGYSLNEYINRLRIGEAQSLLISTEHSVQHVGQLVGFENASYFNSIFSRIAGTQPAKFRTNYRRPHA